MRFRVLGGVEVTVDGRVLPFTRRQERRLLGLLLLEAGRAVPADRLVDLMWGETPPAQARRGLHSHVARVRAAFGREGLDGVELVTRRTGYLLRVEPQDVDAHRFRSLVTRATGEAEPAVRRDLLGAALELWRGPVLGDDAGEHLRQRVGADLDALRLVALEQQHAALLDLGAYDEALPSLARHTVEFPARERFAELWMTALYRTGRKAEALAAYDRTRAWLLDHLGVEPAGPLRDLHGAILRDDVPAAAGVPATAGAEAAEPGIRPAELPADVGGFVGRDRDLLVLDGFLERSGVAATAVVVSAIAGTAGVGKTALAVHFGHRVADRFPDGQVYVNLRGYAHAAPMSPIEALTRLLGSIGVPAEQIPVDEEAASALYRSRLAGRRMFVLLDNAESAEQVRPLLPAEPGCLAVVTSRDRLAGLVASHGARRLELDVLDPADARTLLIELLGGRRVSAEDTAAVELTELCAHLPLALRMAAANLVGRPQWSIADYVAALKADRLGMLEVDGDVAVRSAFNLSYSRLPDGAQRMFRLLGLVPGPDVTPEAAAALAEVDVRQAARLLDRLAAAHLIEEHRPRRYTCHDLLRLHAREQTDDEPSARDTAIERLATWYLAISAHVAAVAYPQVQRLPATDSWAARAEVGFDSAADGMAWLDAESANLAAVIVQVAERGPRPVAWLLADALRGYFWLRDRLADRTLAANAALAAAVEEGDAAGEAAARLGLADASRDRAMHAPAVEQYEAALLLTERSDWSSGAATAHNSLAWLLAEQGKLRRATEHLRAAREILHRLGNPVSEATVAANLGVVYLHLGRLEEAEELLSQAVTLGKREGVSTAITLNNLVHVVRFRGRYDEALDHAIDAVELHRAAGHRLGESLALTCLAATYCDVGDFDRALENARAALSLGHDSTTPHADAAALNAIGTVHRECRQFEPATEAHRQAASHAVRAGRRYEETEALVGLGAAYLGLGRHDEALAQTHLALTRAREAEYRLLEGQALMLLAEVHRAVGDPSARECAEQALAIHRETGYRLGEERTLAFLESAT